MRVAWAALRRAGSRGASGAGCTEITYVTLADGRRQERRLPLLFRLLLPLAPNLDPLFPPSGADLDARPGSTGG